MSQFITPTTPQTLVQDLLWVANSPSLIRYSEETSRVCLPISTGEIDLEALRAFVSRQPTHRVGRYFENLFHFWQQQVLGQEVLARGWQIREDRRTLGELDFVLKTPAGHTLHVEIAVKFYLHSRQPHSTGSHWIGPNSRDTFEKKVTRLFDHQLPMSRYWPATIDGRIPFMKGRMFYHPNHLDAETPAMLDPGHVRGLWLYNHEIDGLSQKEARFLRLEKPYWLSDVQMPRGSLTDRLWTFEEFREQMATHFSESDRPWLLAVMNETESGLQETTRLFVVDSKWPVERH